MQPRFRLFLILSMFLGATLLALAIGEADAQPPGGKKGKGGGGPPETADSFIAKMMAFNQAKDGKLTKTELTDTRLLSLFDRADANKDGVVTREELQALFTKESIANTGKGGFGDKGKGDKGKGDKGKGDKGKSGFGFKDGPQPGQVLNSFMRDMLNLTDAQKQQLADLQKDVDAKLNGILTDDQRKQLRDMSGPKGFGDKKGPYGGKKGEPK